MNCSIVIPAHNEAQTISRTLDSILDGDPINDGLTEFVIIGSACTDDTLGVAEAYFDQRQPEAELQLLESGRGQQVALNAGLLAARGEIILCADADVLLDAATLPAMHDALARDRKIKLVGALATYNLHELPDDTNLAELLHAEVLRKTALGVRKSVQGACLGFKAEDGFSYPESITPNDVWISAEIADKYGLDAITVFMDKRAYSTPPQNWDDYLALKTRYGVAHELLRLEYPELFHTVTEVTAYIEADRSLREISSIWQQDCLAQGIDVLNLVPTFDFVLSYTRHHSKHVIESLIASAGIWEPVTSTKPSEPLALLPNYSA